MSTREQEAMRYCAQGERRVKETPPPAGQKFLPGTRVRIADDLGRSMGHFPSGKTGTVQYTYAHAFGGTNTHSYSIDVDGVGEVAWYYEHQLTACAEAEFKIMVERGTKAWTDMPDSTAWVETLRGEK